MFFFSQFITAFILIFLISSFSSANTPGTPSSSYKNDYFSKQEKNLINTTPTISRNLENKQNQIVIKGNKRLEL